MNAPELEASEDERIRLNAEIAKSLGIGKEAWKIPDYCEILGIMGAIGFSLMLRMIETDRQHREEGW